ncbi:hypothetical protein V6N12_023443 [Hibiscus sabdariffa]|uniref:Leucine-rich repeat-containing N-terminal plant-type domain-containing protein n=1 Tax=Hibiscus sabdariffa TaxID=183260 RepID=A0ABR2FYA2_9ROSI
MGNTRFILLLMLLPLLSEFELILSVKSTTSLNSDSSALLALKNHVIVGLRSILATNWSVSVSVCEWIGVTTPQGHCLTSIRHDTAACRESIFPQYTQHGEQRFSQIITQGVGYLGRMKSINLTNNNFDGVPTLDFEAWKCTVTTSPALSRLLYALYRSWKHWSCPKTTRRSNSGSHWEALELESVIFE